MTEAVVTDKGQAMSDALDAARERLAGIALAGWSENDLKDLARLLRPVCRQLNVRAKRCVDGAAPLQIRFQE